MSSIQISTLQIRRATTAEWESVNPILSQGEFGLDTTLQSASASTFLKLGDGETRWNNLSWFSSINNNVLVGGNRYTLLSLDYNLFNPLYMAPPSAYYMLPTNRVVNNTLGAYNGVENNRLYVPEGVSKIRVSCHAVIRHSQSGPPANPNGVRQLLIWKNSGLGPNPDGSPFAVGASCNNMPENTGTSADITTISAIMDVSAGDYFEAAIYQDSGEERNIAYGWIMMEEIGASLSLTPRQVDAIVGANNPSAINTFATLSDISGGGGGGGVVDITYSNLYALASASELIPNQKYRITDFKTEYPLVHTANTIYGGPNSYTALQVDYTGNDAYRGYIEVHQSYFNGTIPYGTTYIAPGDIITRINSSHDGNYKVEDVIAGNYHPEYYAIFLINEDNTGITTDSWVGEELTGNINWTNTRVATTEVIYVTAKTVNELEPIATSESHPKDILYYELSYSGGWYARPYSYSYPYGRIYRRIDEFGNDVPEDFRYIKNRRWRNANGYTSHYFPGGRSLIGINTYYDYVTEGVFDTIVLASKPDLIVGDTIVIEGSDSNDGSYTITAILDSVSYGFPAEYMLIHVAGQSWNSTGGGNLVYYPNFLYVDRTMFNRNTNDGVDIMNNKFGQQLLDYQGNGRPLNIIFGNSDVGYCECYGNTFGLDCYDMTFGYTFKNNTFGNNCYNNTFGNNCYNNTFGNNCYNNIFSGAYNNSFGHYCYGNTFLGTIRENTIGNYFTGNQFNLFRENTMGFYCYDNISLGQFQENRIGDSFVGYRDTTNGRFRGNIVTCTDDGGCYSIYNEGIIEQCVFDDNLYNLQLYGPANLERTTFGIYTTNIIIDADSYNGNVSDCTFKSYTRNLDIYSEIRASEFPHDLSGVIFSQNCQFQYCNIRNDNFDGTTLQPYVDNQYKHYDDGDSSFVGYYDPDWGVGGQIDIYNAYFYQDGVGPIGPYNIGYCGVIVVKGYGSSYNPISITSMPNFSNHPVTIKVEPGFKIYLVGNNRTPTDQYQFYWDGAIILDGDKEDSITLEKVYIGGWYVIREKN